MGTKERERREADGRPGYPEDEARGRVAQVRPHGPWTTQIPRSLTFLGESERVARHEI